MRLYEEIKLFQHPLKYRHSPVLSKSVQLKYRTVMFLFERITIYLHLVVISPERRFALKSNHKFRWFIPVD